MNQKLLTKLRNSISLILLMLPLFSFAQRKRNPFAEVNVPDSIGVILARIAYHDTTITSGVPQIQNLVNRHQLIFKTGIYSYNGRGPHFPRRIFVVNKGKTYVFHSIGAFDPLGVLEDLVKCADVLKLSDKQIVLYTKIVANYLKEEEGQTYGTETD